MQMVLLGGFLNHVESFEKPSAVVPLLSQFDQRENMGYFLKEHEAQLRHKLHYYLRMQSLHSIGQTGNADLTCFATDLSLL